MNELTYLGTVINAFPIFLYPSSLLSLLIMFCYRVKHARTKIAAGKWLSLHGHSQFQSLEFSVLFIHRKELTSRPLSSQNRRRGKKKGRRAVRKEGNEGEKEKGRKKTNGSEQISCFFT